MCLFIYLFSETEETRVKRQLEAISIDLLHGPEVWRVR